MDELEFRTGQKANAHLTRHADAVRTMQRHQPVAAAALVPTSYPDGRVGWPHIVGYRLADGSLLPYPPTKLSHPDKSPPPKHAVMQRDDKTGGRSVPFETVIYDKAAYDELPRTGQLYGDAHAGGEATITDNRRTS